MENLLDGKLYLITGGLYLGDQKTAMSPRMLKEVGINSILTVASEISLIQDEKVNK